MKERALIYGAGELGRQMYRNLATHLARDVEIVGFVDDVKPAGTKIFEELRVLGSLEQVGARASFQPGEVQLVPAIGYADMRARRAAFERADALGYSFRGFRHPQAIVDPSAEVDLSVITLAGAIVDHETRVGRFCYLDIGIRIGEWSRLEDNCYFAAGAAVGGSVTVGRDTFLGMDATVVNDIAIGSHVFVNASTLVSQDIPHDSRVIEARKFRVVPIDAFK